MWWCSWLDGEAERLGGLIAEPIGDLHGKAEGSGRRGRAGQLVVVVGGTGGHQRQPGGSCPDDTDLWGAGSLPGL